MVAELAAARIAPPLHLHVLEPTIGGDGERHLAGFRSNGEPDLRTHGILPVHATSSRQSADGNQTDSAVTRPAAERVISGPEAVMIGIIPSSFHRIAPAPSKSRSNPVIGMPYIRTMALQIIPRPQWITCSAVNGSQRPSLISPCIRRRTAEASGVPGAMRSEERRVGK